jgi:7-cyano-7-deazaguanine synthase
MANAVVLLSGGLDSMVCAALAREAGFEVLALTIDYNQRHRVELEAARRIAAMVAERHIVLPIDLRAFGGSALTGDTAVPKGGVEEGIPVTYVPARNTIFLSLALGWAEATGARDLFIGVNALDYSGYPDCRPDFIAAFERTANLATKAGVEGEPFTIHAPLQHMSKADIAREAHRLRLDAGLSHSCYDPVADGRHCGLCDACRLRSKGFAEAGLADPTSYA